MTEAMVGFMFGEMKLDRVFFTAYGQNTSIHALNKKLGFTLEGVLRRHVQRKDGEVDDLYMFGMLADEWKARGRKPDR